MTENREEPTIECADDDSTMIRFQECRTRFEAETRLIALRDAGVEAQIAGERRTSALDEAVQSGKPLFSVWVRRDQIDLAHEAVAESDRAAALLQDDDVDVEGDAPPWAGKPLSPMFHVIKWATVAAAILAVLLFFIAIVMVFIGINGSGVKG